MEQQKLGERWMTESNYIKTTYEKAIGDLQSQLSRSNERIQELEIQHLKTNSIRQELIAQITNEKKNVAKLQNALSSNETRIESFLKQ